MSELYFPKLPQSWQDAINDVIGDFDNGEHPDIAEAFREVEGQDLDKVLLEPDPSDKDIADITVCYGNFVEGWNAALRYMAKSRGHEISAWIRSNSAPTEIQISSDKSSVINQYRALIVMESDVIRLEGGGA